MVFLVCGRVCGCVCVYVCIVCYFFYLSLLEWWVVCMCVYVCVCVCVCVCGEESKRLKDPLRALLD